MPAINPLSSQHPSLITPAIRIIAITPADADLSHVCRMLYVGTGGDVAVRDLFGTTVIHKNVAGGTYLGPFAVDRVLSTGSTATDILGYV
jgi:hypothetical protein